MGFNSQCVGCSATHRLESDRPLNSSRRTIIRNCVSHIRLVQIGTDEASTSALEVGSNTAFVVLDTRPLRREGLHEELGAVGEFSGELNGEGLVVAELVVEVTGIEEDDVHTSIGALGRHVKVPEIESTSNHGGRVHLEAIQIGRIRQDLDLGCYVVVGWRPEHRLTQRGVKEK